MFLSLVGLDWSTWASLLSFESAFWSLLRGLADSWQSCKIQCKGKNLLRLLKKMH